jgi:hypothetical protein
MAEIKIYPTYEIFYRRINEGKEGDYFLTQNIPMGRIVTIGETPLPNRKGLRRLLPYREERAVVCVGGGDNARPVLAINRKRLEELGGRLGTF